jgi:crotonobetainyl-CoA:carnitine CoA-transferase CaiB-like acyl-CoA transferase
LGFPIKFSDNPCQIHRPPPTLGADNEAVLGQLGLTTAAINDLRARGVV